MALTNRTVVVTGAASGIGSQTARVLKGLGSTVIGVDLRTPHANVDRFIEADLADPVSIANAADQIDARSVHALANIAGLPPTQPIPAVLAVNFLGLRAFTEAMIPKLADEAPIVTVASIAGAGWRSRLDTVKALLELRDFSEAGTFAHEHGIDAEEVYGLTKEAIIVWTMASSDAWAERRIRINCVSPGPVATAILPDFVEALPRAADDMSLIDRPGEAYEIAPTIAFLCDPENTWINGANFPVDGGLSAAIATRDLGLRG